jgi:hypothetical protein
MESLKSLVKDTQLADNSPKSRIRVGLLIDSFTQPQWIYKIIQDIRTSSIAEIALVIKNQESSPAKEEKKKPKILSLWQNRDYLLYSIYSKFDDYKFKVPNSALAIRNIEELISDCPVIVVDPIKKKFSDYFQESDIEQILEQKLDVALRFGFRILRGRALQIARHGVWSYHHADGQVNRGGPAGFWEVMEGQPLTGSMLQILTEELDNGKVLYKSWSPTTDKLSVNINKNNYYWKSSSFVMRKLEDLYENGEAGLVADNNGSSYHPYFNRLYKVPNNYEMFPLMLKLFGRYASCKKDLLYLDQWFLAYRFRTSPEDANNSFYRFKHLVPPKDRFWADPFPVKAGDKYFIFFEEYVYNDNRGYISVIEIDKKGNYKEPVRVLAPGYHLSYPFIFQWQGDYYMIPESSSNRTIEYYRAVSFPYEWKLEKVLMKDVKAVDTTLAEIDGLWWMFVGLVNDGISCSWDELCLYYSDNPLGDWKPHKRNPVKLDARCARPAGRPFYWNGDLYRPAQDCSERYGYAISINKIERLSPTEYLEKEVSKALPRWTEGLLATHTLNSAEDLTVIDGMKKIRRYF